jgi:GDPmannose 4,6-dehydratase
MTSALITGAAGQDGILLSQMLLADGYRVRGLVKPGMDSSVLHRYAARVEVVSCDLGDPDALRAVIAADVPDEIYNLGGISSIMESVNNPQMTHQVNVGAVETILGAMAELAPLRGCRFVQASSGTIFEGSEVPFQNESTPRVPHTPYALAKAEAMERITAAREDQGLFASAAILYNHESPLRGSGFVTRRITEGAAQIAAGLTDVLELGNIDVCRDWGWAPDYVRGMRLMMAADQPGDYVLATGEINWLKDFLRLAFEAAGIADWQDHVHTRDDLRRTTDPTVLRGDSAKAQRELGWSRTRTFPDIAEAMVAYDMQLLKEPAALWHEQ